jgi:hypothetical protein
VPSSFKAERIAQFEKRFGPLDEDSPITDRTTTPSVRPSRKRSELRWAPSSTSAPTPKTTQTRRPPRVRPRSRLLTARDPVSVWLQKRSEGIDLKEASERAGFHLYYRPGGLFPDEPPGPVTYGGYFQPLMVLDWISPEFHHLPLQVALEKHTQKVTPIILDIDPRGPSDRPKVGGRASLEEGHYVARGGRLVRFRMDPARTMMSSWLRPGGNQGLLVWDFDGTGKIDSGAKLFGEFDIDGKRRFSDGYEKLRAYFDLDGDGELKGEELERAKAMGLKIWRDTNANGRVDAGELLDLDAFGIVSIGARPDPQDMSATFTSTTLGTRKSWDVWLEQRPSELKRRRQIADAPPDDAAGEVR